MQSLLFAVLLLGAPPLSSQEIKFTQSQPAPAPAVAPAPPLPEAPPTGTTQYTASAPTAQYTTQYAAAGYGTGAPCAPCGSQATYGYSYQATTYAAAPCGPCGQATAAPCGPCGQATGQASYGYSSYQSYGAAAGGCCGAQRAGFHPFRRLFHRG